MNDVEKLTRALMAQPEFHGSLWELCLLLRAEVLRLHLENARLVEAQAKLSASED